MIGILIGLYLFWGSVFGYSDIKVNEAQSYGMMLMACLELAVEWTACCGLWHLWEKRKK